MEGAGSRNSQISPAENFQWYAILKEVKYNTSLLRFGLCTVSSFKKESKKRGENAGWSLGCKNWQALFQPGNQVCIPDIMWWKWHFISVIFLQKIHKPSLIMGKTNKTNPSWGTSHRIIDQYSSKLSRTSKAKSETLSQPKGPETRRINTMLGWGPGTE